MEENLLPFRLLGGFNAAELWTLNNLVMISWLSMAFAPRWKYTPSIVVTVALMHSFIYSAGFLSLVLFENMNEINEDGVQPSFDSLQGVVALFQDPNNVFLGWVHYSAFDALVGRSILLDSLERRTSTAMHFCIVVPILLLTLLAGPFGWMLYQVVGALSLLPPKCNGDHQNDKKE